MIQLSVNNNPTSIASDALLSNALLEWGFSEMKIAVAINGNFIPRSQYAEYKLAQGDEIDIVKPVGGG